MSQPNWLGLLKWSLAHQDGTAPSQFGQMSEEDKVWLERVMKEAVKDEPQRINEIMQHMKDLLSRPNDPIPESEQEKIEMELEELRDIIEQIDMAQIFTKFGGCEILLSLLTFRSLDNDSKAVAAAAIGTATQNNISTQDILHKQHFLSSLIPIFLQTNTILIKNKLLYAISCMIRGHAAAEEFFVVTYLQALSDHLFSLPSSTHTLLARFFFLVDALITSDYASLARIEHIVNLLLPRLLSYIHISTISPDLQENAMNVLISLSQTTSGWERLSTFSADVQTALQRREQSIRQPSAEDDEMSKEEKMAALKQIIRVRVNLGKLTVQYPLSAVAGGNNTAATTTADAAAAAASNDASNNDNTSDNTTNETVLLIEPPSLTASSPIP